MKKILFKLILVISIIGCNNSTLTTSSKNEQTKKIFFPTQNKSLPIQQDESRIIMESRLAGILKKDENDCLRVNKDLIIWPYGSIIKDDLIYDRNGNLIAEIGEYVIFGGGGISSEEDSKKLIKNISKDLPNPKCSEPYFFVNTIL